MTESEKKIKKNICMDINNNLAVEDKACNEFTQTILFFLSIEKYGYIFVDLLSNDQLFFAGRKPE